MLVLRIFLFFYLLSFIHSSLMKNEILSKLNSRQNRIFYQKFKFHYNFSAYHPSPFEFDPECIEVHRTHSWFFQGCTLPPSCGDVHTKILDSSFGFKELMCYSFHKSQNLSLVNISPFSSFSKFNFTFKNQLKDYGYFETLENIEPVDFFEHFFLYVHNGLYSLLPKICIDNYITPGQPFPSSVLFSSSHDDVCFTHNTGGINCELKLFKSVGELFMHYNFPLKFRNSPFSTHSYEKTGNTEIHAIENYQPLNSVYLLDNNSPYSYSVSSSVHLTPTPYVLRFPIHNYNGKTHCFKVHSKYVNPLASILKFLLQSLTLIFSEIIKALEFVLKPIINLAFKFLKALYDEVSALFNSLLNSIPQIDHVLDTLLVFVLSLIHFHYYHAILISLLYVLNLFYFSYI
uniref:Putative virion glycoprotein N-terminal domain-containing protein n=1 Tax=Loreto virus TaxID=1170422 RepID=M1F281_9VIRU|nr:hypothetical protein 2 [Loreto virus]AFI24694.1 hypothetical protein 2 [Loreto virus]